jgi:NAD-dependent histone deacetylase SIR2
MADPDEKKRHSSPRVEIPRRRVSSDSESTVSRTPSPSSSSFAFAVEIPVSTDRHPSMDVGRRSLPYEVLDLTLDNVASSALCKKTMDVLYRAKRMIVVAGAGISVAAGIPDFRSQGGLFSTLKADTKFKPSGKALFDVSVYKVLLPTGRYVKNRARLEPNPTMK